MGDQPAGVAAVAALARSLRLEAGLSTRLLAARSGLARSTITRLEAGQLRPRRSMLAVLAVGLDPGRPRELLDQLAAAAAGDMAEDTPGWRRYRRRRVGRALRSGALPLPAEVARRIRMHRAADEALRQVAALQRQPDFMGDLKVAEMADELIRRAEGIRAQAGPRMTVASLQRQLTEGMDDGGPT
jgi:transcriptional regulator with XRE-family HTH domain